MNNEFYTLQEVADLLKVQYLTIFRWVKGGKLSAYKFGKQYRVSAETLQHFIDSAKVPKNSNEEENI